MTKHDDIIKLLRLFAQGLNSKDIAEKFPAYDQEKINRLLKEIIEQWQAQRTGIRTPGYFVACIDGASRGNPGPGALGIVIYNPRGEIAAELKETLGVCTNNVAEYKALRKALELAREMNIRALAVKSDSQLLVRQMQGQYKIKDEKIKALYQEVQALLKEFDQVELKHVFRAENKLADKLANEALDAQDRMA